MDCLNKELNKLMENSKDKRIKNLQDTMDTLYNLDKHRGYGSNVRILDKISYIMGDDSIEVGTGWRIVISRQFINKLSERERYIINEHKKGKAYIAIGKELGISGTRVAQIVGNGIDRLRRQDHGVFNTLPWEVLNKDGEVIDIKYMANITGSICEQLK